LKGFSSDLLDTRPCAKLKVCHHKTKNCCHLYLPEPEKQRIQKYRVY